MPSSILHILLWVVAYPSLSLAKVALHQPLAGRDIAGHATMLFVGDSYCLLLWRINSFLIQYELVLLNCCWQCIFIFIWLTTILHEMLLETSRISSHIIFLLAWCSSFEFVVTIQNSNAEYGDLWYIFFVDPICCSDPGKCLLWAIDIWLINLKCLKWIMTKSGIIHTLILAWTWVLLSMSCFCILLNNFVNFIEWQVLKFDLQIMVL